MTGWIVIQQNKPCVNSVIPTVVIQLFCSVERMANGVGRSFPAAEPIAENLDHPSLHEERSLQANERPIRTFVDKN